MPFTITRGSDGAFLWVSRFFQKGGFGKNSSNFHPAQIAAIQSTPEKIYKHLKLEAAAGLVIFLFFSWHFSAKIFW